MRKFIFNGKVLSAVFGAVSLIQTTRKGTRDWRIALMWISWVLTLTVAIGTAVIESKQAKISEKTG